MAGRGVAVSSASPGQRSPCCSPSDRVSGPQTWVLSLVEWGEPSFSPVRWGELSLFLVQSCLEPCDRPQHHSGKFKDRKEK